MTTERDISKRPVGTCPDCGRPITLQLTGWWTHDGLSGDCWRQSMDGPGDLDDDDYRTVEELSHRYHGTIEETQ